MESKHRNTADKDVGFLRRMEECANRVGNVAKLSRKCGISQTTLGDYIKGRSDVPRERLIKIAEAANVSVLWLATGGGAPEEKADEDCLSEEYISKYMVSLDNVKAASEALFKHLQKTKKKLPPEKAAQIIVLLSQISAEEDGENVDETNLIRLVDLAG